MRRFSLALISVISTIAFTQSASAADLPRKAPVYTPPPPPPVYSWTGFYVGGNIGYSWGKVDSAVDEPDLGLGLGTTFTDSVKPKGIIGGGQIGYNWQANPNWVLGIEADIQASGQKDSHSFSNSFSEVCSDCIAAITIPGTATFSREEQLEWFGTVRGRIGYTFWNNNLMLYGTGGLAYGHVNSSLTTTATLIDGTSLVDASFNDSKTKAGWTVGAGVEGVIPNMQNWTWKVEYLYIDLGSVNYAFSDPNLGTVTISEKVTDNIVRVGVNLKFN